MKKLDTSNTGIQAVKPWVKIMMMLKMSPYQARKGCSMALYGSISREMSRAFRARMKAMWHAFSDVQVMKPATPEMFWNQLKTVLPELETFMNPSKPKAEVKATL